MAIRVLLVEDDAWMQRVVTTVLRAESLEVDHANDGATALAKATASPPDLVISDVLMPGGMDGFTLVKQMRAHRELAFVPFIFLTSLSSAEDMLRGFQLGADDYLGKPFQPDELRARVRSALRRRQQLEHQARGAIRPDVGERQGLRGSLQVVGLSTLLLLLDMEEQSGIIFLTRVDPPCRCRLFVRQGRIVQTAVDEGPAIAGADVVYHALAWPDGQFEFLPAAVEMADVVQQPTTVLLREGGHRLDADAADEDEQEIHLD